MFVNNFYILTRLYYLRNQCSFYLQWLLLLLTISYNPRLAKLKAKLGSMKIINTHRIYSHTSSEYNFAK